MTIAQQSKITEFPFKIYNSQGKEIYFEDSNGYWYKREYNSQGQQIYYEDSKGYWSKFEYNSQGQKIYFESSKGYIEDKRPKEVTLSLDEIAAKFNIPVSQLKIKK